MTVNKHIAIVVCDTPIPELAPKYGDFGQNITDLLNSTQMVNDVRILSYHICGDNKDAIELEYERLTNESNVIGVILSGGRGDAFSKDDWVIRLDRFLEDVLLTSGVPITGICFGHQILAKLLGCPVGRSSNGWECGVTKICVSPEAKPLLETYGIANADLFNLSEFHQDHVYSLPEPQRDSTFVNLGTLDRCQIQGMVTKEGPLKILTFQGHPEFGSQYMLEMLDLNHKKGKLSEKQFREFTDNTSALHNEGASMAKAIVSFFKTNN